MTEKRLKILRRRMINSGMPEHLVDRDLSRNAARARVAYMSSHRSVKNDTVTSSGARCASADILPEQGLSQIPVEDNLQTDDVATLTHLTSDGEAHMVSIANKRPSSRSATATALLLFSRKNTYHLLSASRLRKGDALAVARIAGVQAAKKTSDLIPLAHPGLDITGVTVRLDPFEGYDLPFPLSEHSEKDMALLGDTNELHGGVLVTATVACDGKTGVEMEAITAASIAGLTMYDMLKGVDKCMVLTSTRVVAKSGGKSGDWKWNYKLHDRIVTRAPEQSSERGRNREQQPDRASAMQLHLEKSLRRLAELEKRLQRQAQLEEALERQHEKIQQLKIQHTVEEGNLPTSTKGPVTAHDFVTRRRANFK